MTTPRPDNMMRLPSPVTVTPIARSTVCLAAAAPGRRVGCRLTRAATRPFRGAAFVAFAAVQLASAQPRSAAPLPANFNYQTDTLGFRWDINQSGMVNDGSDDCFDGGMMLQVNGQQFNANQPMMTPDGCEFLLGGSVGGVEVMRRVKVDAKASFVRYVEQLTNAGSSTQTVSVNILSYFGGNPQAVMTDRLRPAGGDLGRGESAVLAFQSAGSSRPSVLYYLGDERSRHKPRVLATNGHRQFQFTWSLAIRPGRTVTLMYAVAQRRFQTMPDAKALEKAFKPIASRSFVKELPAKLRREVLNWSTGGYGGDGPARFNLEAELGVAPQTSDILALGEGTRLMGTAACEQLVIETRYGKKEIAFEQVAALVGSKRPGSRSRLYLRDGQVLVGPIEARGLRFSMNTGLAIDLDPKTVDRLVLHASPDDGTPAPDATAYVATHHGDRLAVTLDPALRFGAVTPWGVLRVAVDDVAFVQPQEGGEPGFTVRLKDGSRFFAYLGGAQVQVRSMLFDAQTLDTAEIRVIASATGAGPIEDQESIAQPHVVLVGGQVLVGRIDLPALHVLALGEVIPVTPAQVRVLRNQSGDTVDDATQAIPAAPTFEAELWGGGRVAGPLRETTLPLRVGEDVCHVPARDLVEAHVPTPTVPDAVRARIAALVRDLGHPEWARRETASQELAELGFLARGLLRETMGQSSDPEVRRRAESLLSRIEDAEP